MRSPFRFLLALALAASARAASAAPSAPADRADFGRQIRPLLSDNCFTCHGPDEAKRKAKLRLDTQEGALAERSGRAAVVPGKPEASELIARITTADEDDRMPPPKSGKQLTAEQIALLKRWIEQGAEWQQHWAFAPLRKPEIPHLPARAWARNPIDLFVLARLQAEGLTPATDANQQTLIRRVTLDLTGLPPTPSEVDAFLADTAPDAYERLVDRLLKSPRYGEQMARLWLDGARYGDTHGLHLDNERSIWPYRDWVIRAFNENQPFDQFTVEQLAGDLLPNPTREQLVATGFNRCNVTTSEGGAIPDEFAARYAVDRVETTATVWMGLTAGCAACHDHKYDPLTQKEFYQLFAFFNNLDEDPMDGNALLPPPTVQLSTPDQEARMEDYDRQVAQIEKVIRAALLVVDDPDSSRSSEPTLRAPKEFVWLEDDLPEGAKPSTDGEAWKLITSKEGPVLSGQKAAARASKERSQHLFTEAKHKLLIGRGDRLFAHVYLDPKDPPREIMLQFNAGSWEHRAFWGEDLIDWGKADSPERRRVAALPEAGRWVRLEVEAEAVGLHPGDEVHGLAFTQHGGSVYWDKAGIVSKAPQGGEGFRSQRAWEEFQLELKELKLPEDVRKALQEESSKRSRDQQRRLHDYFVEFVRADTRRIFDPLHQQFDGLKKEREGFDRSITRTMITKDRKPPRETHILVRGAYDKKGERVSPDVPAILPRLPEGQPSNRLGLARWLVDPSHPLTARVTVNRIWQQHFGVGLVKTAENFGAQGEPPSHPGLLDWLATEFVARGWDVKSLHRLIVTSATYRQSSATTAELAQRDPENRWLARGPRFRLDAEAIRDSVLAVSGLLVEKIGGRGVRPYQPDAIWEPVAYPTSTTAKYRKDEGEALYRRSLYTFWKRTAPPPSMMAFDAPMRESCRVRRERTNTPAQALALLNDIQYIEAARHLAVRMIDEGGEDPARRLAFGFRLATARFPDPQETNVLRRLYEDQLTIFRQEPEAAKKLIALGDSRPDASLDAPDLAAWTMVANTLLNLSETITLN
jgi:mono/diheme cytochrome c family protein